MKLFNIYIKKSENEIIEDLVAVKNGFSLTAFFFTILWFLQHKMWKEALSLLAVNSIFITLFQKDFFGSLDFFIMQLGLFLIISLNANYWYEQHLQKRTYQFAGCVFGKNKDEAKLRFISNCFKDQDHSTIFCSSIADMQKTKEFQQYFTI